ncbi:MAG TPA: tetratricopeptide repeat protein [Terriglobales bacterium]|nr:tetratricopeptide repeat protein [Terriglobales bacterium]
MRRFVVIVATVALILAAVYLVSLNSAQTEFRFTPTWVVAFPLGGIVIGAFLSGATVVLLAVALQASQRAVSMWRQTRQRRQREQYDELQERGGALMWEGDPKQARALLEKALRRRPESASAVLALASSYRATGETRRAVDLLIAAATKHHSTNPEVLLALAEAQGEAGERGAQLETLERLRALHPRAPLVLGRLRSAYADAGRWPEAASAQEVFLAESRDPAHLTREQERLLAFRYQTALQIAEPIERARALAALSERRLAPVPVAVSLGDAQLAGNEPNQAWDTWERALRATPRTVLVERLSQLAQEPKRQDRLCSLLGKLRAEEANLDHARLYAAQIQLMAGRVSEAGNELDAIAAEDGPSLLHRLRAEVLHKRGQTDQALSAYGQAGRGVPLEHRCRSCSRASEVWLGYCPSCAAWDSFRSTVEIARG